MAQIVEYREIPVNDLVIGRGQVRTTRPGRDIEELAQSIKVQGLLQPIVVCEARDSGKWEILTGQRRFLAHRMLNKATITAAVLDSRVEEQEAKAISITENMIRRKLSPKELKDGIRHLYKYYGSIADVVEATGLSRELVRNYIKYPRLIPDLKELVDNEEVDINVALNAQDASEDESGKSDFNVAVELAKEMQTMSGVQRKKVIKERKENPETPIEDVIEDAKTGGKVIQVVVTISSHMHQVIQAFASGEGVNQDEATANLIEEALTNRGLLE